ncbi:MAG: hypothetical protein WDO24_04545 [Pseudomonadota bacterium]
MILVGGNFPHGARRALAFGDAWMPLASMPSYEDAAAFVPRFRQMAAEAGAIPPRCRSRSIHVPEDADRLARYRDLGIIRVIVSLPSAPADEILPVLDRWAELVRRTNG